jgi:hypothetical protein
MADRRAAGSPWEGFRVAFNGTKGRIELECIERGPRAPGPARPPARPPAGHMAVV